MNSVRNDLLGSGAKTASLAILLDPENAVNYAHQYSALSKDAPWLVEVSFDDFVAQYQKVVVSMGAVRAENLLQQFIDNLKSTNPKLKFGITVYETEFGSATLSEPFFSSRLRNEVDYVHLYVLYRENGPNFENYVRQARNLFPHAKVIAGVYDYDRQDYLPCKLHGKNCTTDEEAALFKKTTQIQFHLLRTGEIDGLELAPGYHGRDAQWDGWKSDPRSCQPNRLAECIQNTTRLRQGLAQIATAAFAH